LWGHWPAIPARRASRGRWLAGPNSPLCLFLTAALLMLPGCAKKGNKPAVAEVDRLSRLETVVPERVRLPVLIELSAMVEAMEKAAVWARGPGVAEWLRSEPAEQGG